MVDAALTGGADLGVGEGVVEGGKAEAKARLREPSATPGPR